MILPRPPDSIVGDSEHLPRRHPGSSPSLELVTTLLILRMYTWGKEQRKDLLCRPKVHYAAIKSHGPVPTVYYFFSERNILTHHSRLCLSHYLFCLTSAGDGLVPLCASAFPPAPIPLFIVSSVSKVVAR